MSLFDIKIYNYLNISVFTKSNLQFSDLVFLAEIWLAYQFLKFIL